MKPAGRMALVLGWVLVATVLTAVAPISRGDNPSPSPSILNPPQKASLDALDQALVRFDALLARDDDARHRAAMQAMLDILKKRRDALRAAYDQSKYDDLRTDLNLAYQRLAAWMAPPHTPPPPARSP